MYNLQMNMPVDLSPYPFRWLMHWSRSLEQDLMKRRMDAKQEEARRARLRALTPRRR